MDASNVVGARPDGWWRDRARALHRLLDEIARWRAEVGEPVLVVADGHPSAWVLEGTLDGVHVRYAHSTDRDAADDEIVRVVAGHDRPDTLVVATSDRRLVERVRRLGASTEGAARFRERIEDIDPRHRDRAILATFGIDERALLGRGGEARVFAVDDAKVVRIPHPGADEDALHHRRRLLDSLATDAPFRLPAIVEMPTIEGRTVAVERRLPGRNALEVLNEPRTDRTTLIHSHLDATRTIAALHCPTEMFGELWGTGALTSDSFADWATRRLEASLRVAGDRYAHLDPGALTADLVAGLHVDPSGPPVLVHLDAYLGNMLAIGDRISAVIDFGPMTIGGPIGLDPAVAVAYLASEITPTASDRDRGVARRWAHDIGLGDAIAPAERWIAAYWTAAQDDQRLQAWCRRVLLEP